MSEPKISVIVPIYKAEKYVRRCIDSILAQTFEDFELLLIDDGSPDNSGKICDEYSHKDSRIRVVHKENGGVSSARQCGLYYARGEYIIHADPDDWIDEDMYEEMYNEAIHREADLVICDFKFEYSNSKSLTVFQDFEQLNSLSVLKKIYQCMYGCCWNKLVKRSCIINYNIQFPKELFYGEDLYVNTCLLSHPIKIAYVSKPFYHYDQIMNQNSLIRRPLEQLFLQSKLLYTLLEKNISSSVFFEIRSYLLCTQASIALRLGQPYIDNFQRDYTDLREHINVEASLKNRLLLIIAFKVSPNFAYRMIRLYMYFMSIFKR